MKTYPDRLTEPQEVSSGYFMWIKTGGARIWRSAEVDKLIETLQNKKENAPVNKNYSVEQKGATSSKLSVIKAPRRNA